jgi:predicted nucleic acid-binding protein
MTVLLDTGIVYAYYDRSDDWHARARKFIHSQEHGLVLPSPVIPEIDHLLGHRLGRRSRQVFYSGIVDGYYLVADLPRQAYARVAELNRQFEDLDLGFVDASIVAIAEGLGLQKVATTDRRHFEPVARALMLELLP